MKKTYQYIALAVLSLGLAACTQEDDFTPQGNQKDAPLAIASAGVADLTTRATITDGMLTEGSIGVYVTSTTEKDRYKGSNIEWTYNNGSWQLATGSTAVLFENNGENQQIGAYYPYTTELTNGLFAIELPETFDSNYEDYDYLYADYAALRSNPATITMNHLLSKVTVSISSMGTQIEDGEVVQSISLFNVPRTASWAVPTSSLSGWGSTDQVTTLFANDTDNDQTVDNYVGYALPNAATTLGIRVTMDSGRSFAAQVPISDGLASGNHYMISMKLGKDALTVGSITIVDWATPDNNPTGSEVTEIFIRSTVSGTTAAIDIVSSVAEGVQNAISELLTANPSVTTLTVNGTPSEVQQSALAAALNDFSGKLVMDMTEVTDAISSLSCEKQLGGYTYDETTTTYTVYTEAGLNKWREAVTENAATNLTLGADIILSTDGITVDENGKPNRSNWTRTGSYYDPFKGTLDGGGHSIVNLRSISKSADGFIAYTKDATIKNLTMVNPVVYTTGEVAAGLLVYLEASTSIINCHVQGGSIAGGYYAGGLIGMIQLYVNYCYIYGCTNSAKVTATYDSGGILGRNVSDDGVVVIAACANTGEISGINQDKEKSQVGGIVGQTTIEKLIACYTTEGNLCGDTNATVKGSYYVASEERDEDDETTAVADAAELNSAEVVSAMNDAISTYNETATVKVAHQWKVGTSLPILEAVSE